MQSFVDEYRAVLTSTHPRFVKILGCCDNAADRPDLEPPKLLTKFSGHSLDRSRYAIVMEVMTVGDLGAWRKGVRPPLNEIIAEGVSELHRLGVVHRNLKPDCVFFTGSDVKLSDFGLDQFVSYRNSAGSSFRIPGVPNYTTPEKVRTK